MKLLVNKASTFEIDPDKKYACIVATTTYWSEDQKSELKKALAGRNIELILLPAGSKFKLTEIKDGQAYSKEKTTASSDKSNQ